MFRAWSSMNDVHGNNVRPDDGMRTFFSYIDWIEYSNMKARCGCLNFI